MTHIDNDILSKLTYVSRLLKNYRINENITQEELCTSADLHVNTIFRLESELPVSFITILKVAEALDFPLRELFLECD